MIQRLIPINPWRWGYLFLVVLWCTACGRTDDLLVVTGPTMGTRYTIKVVNSLLSEPSLKIEIDRELDRLNSVFSTYDPGSELSRLNISPAGENLPISDELMSVLTTSQEIYTLSDGAFDVTVGPLVNLWGFGPDGPRNDIPDADDIKSLQSTIGFDRVQLGSGTIVKHSQVNIDLSAIAKGFAVDVLARLLESKGVDHYLIEIGGEIRARGQNNCTRRTDRSARGVPAANDSAKQ